MAEVILMPPSKTNTIGVVSAVVAVVMCLVTLVGVVWGASADRASVTSDIKALQAVDHELRSDATDREERIRILEKNQHQILTDIQWVRQTLERQMDRDH